MLLLGLNYLKTKFNDLCFYIKILLKTVALGPCTVFCRMISKFPDFFGSVSGHVSANSLGLSEEMKVKTSKLYAAPLFLIAADRPFQFFWSKCRQWHRGHNSFLWPCWQMSGLIGNKQNSQRTWRISSIMKNRMSVGLGGIWSR